MKKEDDSTGKKYLPLYIRLTMKYTIVAILVLLIALQATAQIFTSSNLPIVVIDTHGQEIVDDTKITADMGIINKGDGSRNHLTDAFTDYTGRIGIEFRGSSSQMFPKKPYGFELIDEAGNGQSASLLGMPEEEDWVLIATYNDKSLVRDALAYWLGSSLERYASRTRFCEVVINGAYQGIYMMGEKIKRDKFRVDISKLDPTEVSGSNLTGGYILKIDKNTGAGGAGFTSFYAPPNRSDAQLIYFQYEYPTYDEIVAEQRNYIQSIVHQMENTLNGITFLTSEETYRNVIDIDSFVDFLLINELSRNVDGYRLSTFFYKNKDDDRLVVGPIWDFNLAFGNADYCQGGVHTGWAYNFNYVCNEDWWLIPFWWEKLLNNNDFRRKLVTRWNWLRESVWSTTTMHAYIDSATTVLAAEATTRNFERWPVLGEYVWPNFFIGETYDQEVVWLKEWIRKRAEWMDNNMPIVTGLEGVTKNNSMLEIFPNPVEQEVKISYTLVKPSHLRIEVRDSFGRNVMVLCEDFLQKKTYTWSISSKLPEGAYSVVVREDGVQTEVKKIIQIR